VAQGVVKALQQMYVDLGVNNITTQYQIASSHCFPTTNYGASCSNFGTPFINNCNYDGAGSALGVIFQNLQARGSQIRSNLIKIDQSKFTPNGVNPGSISLDRYGFVYYPTACRRKSTACKLLIALHGCQQYYATVGDAFTRHTGLNDWAETNNIIVLYPQTVASTFSPMNSQGCYDWWGYNEPAYATQAGSQLTTVHNMAKFLINGSMFGKAI